MLNRRKAMIGWLAYTAAKPIVKRALRSRVPGSGGGSSWARVAGIAAAVAGAVGAFAFWRSRRGGDDTGES